MHTDEMTCWDKVSTYLNAGIDRMILFGPPGTGKTYTSLKSYLQPGQDSHRLTCSDDMTNMDVIGGYLPSETGFEYVEGVGIKARRQGSRLVIDEIDKAGGDVFATLLNITDSAESGEWEHPVTGERVQAGHGFTVIMTTNVESMGELPEALTDRFPAVVRIDRPHPNALNSLPYAWRSYADRMADAGDQRMSMRLFQTLNQLADRVGTETAAEMVLGDRAASFLEAIKVDTLQANPI